MAKRLLGEKKFDVVGLGASCLDFIGVVPKFPKRDEEIEMLESTYQGGGEVATALVTLAKLGASVSYIGKIGDDAIVRIIKQEFDHYSVDTSHLIVEQDSYSLASMVMVDRVTGKRTILAGKSTVIFGIESVVTLSLNVAVITSVPSSNLTKLSGSS